MNWLKLDIDILNDSKIKIIRKYPAGNDLFILWIGLLCYAMRSNDPGYVYLTQGIPYTPDELAAELDLEVKTVQMGLELFQKLKMIDFIQGGIIEIINFNKHQQIDKIRKARELMKKRVKKYRDRKLLEFQKENNQINGKKNNSLSDKELNDGNSQNCNAVVTRDNTPCNSLDKNRLDKNRQRKDNIVTKDKPKKIKLRDHVYMTKDEMEKLRERWDDSILKNYVDRLDAYIGSKNKEYKSHYKTIIVWLLKDNVKEKQTKNRQCKICGTPVDASAFCSKCETYTEAVIL